ncbi:MAG: rod shape-determining protein MreC [Oscillospiraceae bacterium]|jgi:rod shape-determining protein MreC|nr:rod shape-determining protein MreC [Oscillospiraceae bacterium]
MKVLLTKKNIAILIAALLVAAVALVSVNTARGPGLISSAATVFLKPVKSAASSVARTFESIYGYMYEYDEVVSENESLKAQIAELRQEYREYTEVSAENDRLRALLELAPRHSDARYDTAAILQWGASNWTSTFTVSKGSANSELAVGNAVITETGVLIGRVTEVGLTSSVAVSVIDTTFSAGALAGGLGEDGIAAGDFSLMRRGLLKLDYLPDDSAILAGDAVVTSGKGGVFPQGLVIGSVAEVRRSETGIGLYAAVLPAAELRDVTYVYIITEFTESQ